MSALQLIGQSLREAFVMFWDTLWALVLGFGLSGAVQAFVSRGQMQRALGRRSVASTAKASALGAVSSSCSYAAAALGKSLFARGADFTSAMVFMFASTNLVVELGIVLWLLIGWQFALAEFVGGAIMIGLLVVVLPRAVPAAALTQARHNLIDTSADEAEPADDAASAELEQAPRPARRLRSLGGWSDAAGYTVSDLTMLRNELVVGFLVAGFAAVLVPTSAWQALFITGHGFVSSMENVILGPFLAVISFVCSVGNVPLAAALWQGGISFGGVVSFVFADLLTIPLLLIYRKCYGTPITLRLLAVFWAVMSLAGLAVEYLFTALGVPEPARRAATEQMGISWNYTTWLNIAALGVFAILYGLYRNRDRLGGGVGYAQDPVCGMQVEQANPPASTVHHGRRVFFCSDPCREHFLDQPDAFASTGANTTGEP